MGEDDSFYPCVVGQEHGDHGQASIADTYGKYLVLKK